MDRITTDRSLANGSDLLFSSWKGWEVSRLGPHQLWTVYEHQIAFFIPLEWSFLTVGKCPANVDFMRKWHFLFLISSNH